MWHTLLHETCTWSTWTLCMGQILYNSSPFQVIIIKTNGEENDSLLLYVYAYNTRIRDNKSKEDDRPTGRKKSGKKTFSTLLWFNFGFKKSRSCVCGRATKCVRQNGKVLLCEKEKVMFVMHCAMSFVSYINQNICSQKQTVFEMATGRKRTQ